MGIRLARGPFGRRRYISADRDQRIEIVCHTDYLRMSDSDEKPVSNATVERLAKSAARIVTTFNRCLGGLAALIAFVAIYGAVIHNFGPHYGWQTVAFAVFMACTGAMIAYGFGRHWIVVVCGVAVIVVIQWIHHWGSR